MRFYTVHLRREATNSDGDLVLVREGFNWFAAVFTVIWAIWNRLWLVAVLLVVIEIAIELALSAAGAGFAHRVVIALAAAILVGLLANDARRWGLDRRNFEMIGVVGANGRDAAELRFFDQRPDLAEELRA